MWRGAKGSFSKSGDGADWPWSVAMAVRTQAAAIRISLGMVDTSSARQVEQDKNGRLVRSLEDEITQGLEVGALSAA